MFFRSLATGSWSCSFFVKPVALDQWRVFWYNQPTAEILSNFRGIVTSDGAHWALKQGAVHLMFPPGALSEPTPLVVHRWKYSVRSPPLQENETIASNVIELSTASGQGLNFNTKVKLSLSHSATDLQGYELVIKRLIDEESNKWEDVDGTKDIRCHRGIEIPLI